MAGKSAKISSKSKSHPEHGKGMGSFFYDSAEGTVFGRTASSWGKDNLYILLCSSLLECSCCVFGY